MTKEELQFILEEGEGLTIEFKQSFDKSITKEMVAFTNAIGGKIFLGISDDREIKGIEITNKIKSQILDIAKNCDPSIKVVTIEVENILIVEVKEGINKPYQCSYGFYLRIGTNSQKLSRDEILEFSIASGKIRFDEQICQKFIFEKHFDEIKFDNFLTITNISKYLPTKQILFRGWNKVNYAE